jgi:glutamine---fructose-6-phosphate transaminase (isomerizing)
VSPNIEVIQGPYFSDLMNQPQALRATWDALRDSSALEKIGREYDRARFERIVLTGMGGSFFGLHPLSMELAANGWTPMMVETSELIHYYPHLLVPSTLVIAVSQSGKSAETVRLLDMNARRAPVIGVSNWADSPLAQEADCAVMTAAGDEHSVSCKTYVSTQMALGILSAALCNKDINGRLREMEMAAEIVDVYLRNWKAHVAEFAELLRSIHDVFLAGRGRSLAAAQTGALTIKESTHLHAEGMSSAALRHGPFEMLKPGIFVGIFAGDARTRMLSEGLVKDIAGTAALPVMFSEDAELASCRLPRVPESLRPIAEILPVQMMTLALAALANREAGKFERATKVTTVE